MAGGQALPSSNFSHTNPLNISEIWTATKFYISMLQPQTWQVYIFFLLFPFLVFTKSQVLHLRMGRSHGPLLRKAYCSPSLHPRGLQSPCYLSPSLTFVSVVHFLEDPLTFLRQQPQFLRLRQMVQANPAVLPQLLQQLGQSNPSLLQVWSQQLNRVPKWWRHKNDFSEIMGFIQLFGTTYLKKVHLQNVGSLVH